MKHTTLLFAMSLAMSAVHCDADGGAVEQRGGGGAAGSAGQAPQGGQVAAGAGGASAGAGGASAGMQGASAGHAGGAATYAGGATAGGGGHGDAGHAQAGQGGVAGASEGGAGGQSAGGGAAAGAGGDVGKGGDGGAGGDVGKAGGGQGGAPVGCKEGRPGPKMVRVPAFDGSSYCIDSTEVTQAQYAEFVAALVPLDSQPKECAFNVRFKPTEDLVPDPDTQTEVGDCPWGFYRPDEHGDAAMGCVDWCDAHMFCQWAGKRLCGTLGGMPLSAEQVDHPEKGNRLGEEWFSACGEGGKLEFSYGATFDQGRCAEAPAKTPVASKTTCHGKDAPFDELFDMSGGATEWIDGCVIRNDSLEPYLSCRISAYGNASSAESRCDFSATTTASNTWASLGIRCCADD